MTRLRRLLCGLRGHDVTLHEEPARLFLQCESCGLTSSGWDVPRLTTPPRWRRYLRFKARLLRERCAAIDITPRRIA